MVQNVPLIADLFLFCYERDFTLSLSYENQSNIIEAFKDVLDDLLHIDNESSEQVNDTVQFLQKNYS